MDFKITSHYIFENHLFFTMEEDIITVFYSEELDIEKLTDNNIRSICSIDKNGKIKKIVPYKNQLFVLREYGVSKIIQLNASDFALINIHFNNGKMSEKYLYKLLDQIKNLEYKGN